jgi:hypothetical protein
MPDDPDSLSPSNLTRLLASIDASAVKSAAEIPDSKTRLESARIQVEFDRERIRSLSQDIDERKKYAHRIFCLICAWLGATFLLLFCCGIGNAKWFSLPQAVLLAMIGGTSADVLGIFYIVTHYLFPQNVPSLQELSGASSEDSEESS